MKFELEKIKYAKVLLEKGVGLKKGQNLHITCPIENADFIELVTKEAYKQGAKIVHVEYINPNNSLIRLENSDKEYLDYYPEYHGEMLHKFASNNTAFLRLGGGIGVDYSNVDLKDVNAMNKAISITMEKFAGVAQSENVACCGSVLPTKAWAKHVFPNLSEEEALDALWDKLLSIGYCKFDDPSSKWDNHLNNVIKARDYLNEQQFETLIFKDDYSDVQVNLAHDHLWIGGCQETEENQKYMPNFPTEEVFCANLKDGINGFVKSSKPLVFQGNIIDDFSFKFIDGKIVEYQARVGEQYLKQLIEFDEGCSYVGEIAILAGETEISKTDTIYKNTLLDENSACHMAIGCAYAINVKDLTEKSAEAFSKYNINYSTNHSDFMFGTKNINVTGIKNNQEYPILVNGEWAIK